MLRDKSLIPLSHQHQRALALCVRIDRAQPIPVADLQAWQTEIEQHFAQEINIHFSAEEQVLFPAARQLPELIQLVDELIADHVAIEKVFRRLRRALCPPRACQVSRNNFPPTSAKKNASSSSACSS